jgi:hypothetical protein
MNWFGSQKGALSLSFIALSSLLLQSYIDTRYILVEDYAWFGASFVLVWTLGYTAILGGWIWALISAAEGRKRAFMVLLGYGVLTAIWIGAGSLVLFLSVPAEGILFSFNLLSGAAASISVAYFLRQAPGK